MLNSKNIFLILCFSCSFVFSQAFGHGVGYEVLPSVQLGDKEVALEVTSSQYADPDNPDREITFALFNTESGITIREVTYDIKAKKGNDDLFHEKFATSDGILVMNFLHSDSDKIAIHKENKASFFDALIGANKDVIQVEGSPFNTGGLYKFKITIETAESFSNKLKNPIELDVGLSVPERTFYYIDDPNYGKQELSVVTYYDEIQNFNYEPTTRAITFSMPFEWTFDNVNQTSVVHEELTMPKAFGDLMVSSFSAKINNFDIPDRTITIDGFSEVQRIVHMVLNKNDLLELLDRQEPNANRMDFEIKPSSKDLPLSTITGNGQFRIVLDWKPKEIRSGEKVTFYFDTMDVFLQNRPVSVEYEVSIIHNEKELYKQTGISTASKDEHNVLEFVVPENVSGPITVQFNNLGGNGLARVGLPVIVDRIGVQTTSSNEISIPDWVRNNAKWWSAEQIGDNDFAEGIEFLIKERIIVVPISEQGQDSIAVIPNWVKNTAGWWADGQISDIEFANALQFLIKNGIISV